MDANRVQYRMTSGKVLFRQITAIRTRIGNQLMGFIQLLADIQNVLRIFKPKRFAASICNADSENGNGADSDSRLSL